jgi:hypothetical protein
VLLSKGVPNTELWFFKTDPLYIEGFRNTFLRYLKERPSTLILQLPQGPLLLEGVLLKKTFNCKTVVDVHTGFVYGHTLKGLILNKSFNKLLNYANLVIVHNDEILDILHPSLIEKTVVVYDPWMFIQSTEQTSYNDRYLVFPASFSPDEPLAEVLRAVNKYKKIKVFVTGNFYRNPSLLRFSSSRVEFTGFLNRQDYEKLLANSFGVITGTKDEYTLMMSAWEAVAFRKPLLLSETKTLRNMFDDYAIFYNWKSRESILNALSEVFSERDLTYARKKLKEKTVNSLNALTKRLKEI